MYLSKLAETSLTSKEKTQCRNATYSFLVKKKKTKQNRAATILQSYKNLLTQADKFSLVFQKFNRKRIQPLLF